MRIVVTGAAGFIGSHVSAELAARGHEVVGVDSLNDFYDPAAKRRNLAEVGEIFSELHMVDLREAVAQGVLSDADAVCHIAAQPGVRPSWGEQFDSYVEANISATESLLKGCLEASVDRLVLASSSSVYGDATERGSLPPSAMTPVSPYGVTKAASEQLCRVYAEAHELVGVALRLFTVYGPRQRPDMAIQRIIEAGFHGRPFRIFGSGEQRRHFTYVGDVARGFAAALDAPAGTWRVFDVADHTQHSLNEVVALVETALGQSIVVERADTVVGDPGDIRPSTLSRDGLDWEPEVSLADGIDRHVEWYRAQST